MKKFLLFIPVFKWPDEYGPDASPYALIPAIISIIALVTFLVTLSAVMGGLINPEYGAVQDILHVMRH